MKFNVYRIQDMGAVVTKTSEEAIHLASIGDVRFAKSDKRFIAEVSVDVQVDILAPQRKVKVDDAPAMTDGEDDDGEA